MYSDIFYLYRFPHRNAKIATCLLFNFWFPHYTVLMISRFFPDIFKAFAKSYKEFFFGFRDWNDPTIDQKSFALTAFIAVAPHKLIRLYLFY